MKRFAALALIALLYATNAVADQCNSPGAPKSSVAIAASATAKLVTGSAATSIYVCGYNFTAAAGTSATYTFSYGTGTTCGTGNTALTGAYAGASGEVITTANDANVFQVPPGNDLCITLGGTGGSAQGVITFVQF